MNLWLRRVLRGGISVGLVLAAGASICAAAQPAPRPTDAKSSLTPADDPMLVRVFPTIVRIEAIRLRPSDGRLTKQWVGGSGVIISREGHLVTNCHVTE